MAKVCPVTREAFRDGSQAVKVLVNDVEMEALPKEFSTGSFGSSFPEVMRSVSNWSPEIDASVTT